MLFSYKNFTLSYLSNTTRNRKDINGLRAIAVLMVIFFHAFPNQIKGGFIGVDIFFVISGFLISSTIFSGLENNKFDFFDFYVRRIRRIFPSLLTVLLAAYFFGWFNLLADEYKQLGKHITGGASFISNFILWNESGYFDNVTETKPLMHLWSLGVEEQFYIICPFVFWLAWKCRINLLIPILVTLFISFGINLHLMSSNPSGDFYSPQSRFWELMIGSCLAWIKLYLTHKPHSYNWGKPHTLSNIQSLLGGLLILSGVFIINKNVLFPGYFALIPTIGAALIISSGEHSWCNKSFLSNNFLNWIGLISFPLYLWHWPLFSFARLRLGEAPSPLFATSLIILTFILAAITYYFIELPLRWGACSKQKSIALLGSSIALLLMGYGLYIDDGFKFRAYPFKFETYLNSASISERKAECFEIAYAYNKEKNWYCTLGKKASKNYAFAFGDSHALSLLPALERYADSNDIKIFFTGESGCPPFLGVQSLRGEENIRKYNCQKLNERIFQFVKKNHIDSVFLIARWSYYYGGITRPKEINFISDDVTKPRSIQDTRRSFILGLNKTIEQYKNIGVKIYLVEDNPQQILDPKDALKKSGLTDATINKFSVSFNEHLRNQAWFTLLLKKINRDNLQVLNFNHVLCNTSNCPFAKNNKLLYSDDDHLSLAGAELIYPELVKQITPLDTSG